MTKWKFVIAAVLVVLAGSFALACGSDDDDGEDNGDNGAEATEVMDGTEMPDATEAPDNGDEPDNGSGIGSGGSATLTVGDEVYEFDNYYCAFGAEETRNDRVSFSSGSFGESTTGARTQLDVSIQDKNEGDATSGEGTIHSISVNDIDDFENPSVAWESITGFIGEPVDEIQIDGGNITAEGSFDDGRTDELEMIPGSFSGTCP